MLIKYLKCYKIILLVISLSLMLTFLTPYSTFAGELSNDFEQIVKNFNLIDSIEIIKFNNNKYIVSIAESSVRGRTPMDKLEALKVSKGKALSNLSKFINGERIKIKEKVTSVRVVSHDDSDSKIIYEEETYDEFLQSKDRGILKKIKYLSWSKDNIYYTASIIKFGGYPLR